jgi:hypothetical protein
VTTPLDVFTNTYTAQQIVRMAEAKAGNPGKHLNANGNEGSDTGNFPFDAIAYMELQSILDELAMVYTWPFARTALNFYVAAQQNDLPANFWRVGFADPCWLIDPDSGERWRLRLLDAEQYHARLIGNPTAARPDTLYISKKNGTASIEASPDKTYVAELHYYPWQPSLASITAQPWFPYHRYLVHALLCELYLLQDDSRWQQSNSEREAIMHRITQAQGDARDKASMKLELDPGVYRKRTLEF